MFCHVKWQTFSTQKVNICYLKSIYFIKISNVSYGGEKSAFGITIVTKIVRDFIIHLSDTFLIFALPLFNSSKMIHVDSLYWIKLISHLSSFPCNFHYSCGHLSIFKIVLCSCNHSRVRKNISPDIIDITLENEFRHLLGLYFSSDSDIC